MIVCGHAVRRPKCLQGKAGSFPVRALRSSRGPQAEAAYEKLFDIIGAALKKDGAVAITGFGSFKVVSRKARKGRNPRTGKEIQIPASKVVKFTAGKALKESI